MGKTIGRKLVDIGQKARGRQALRYEFEVIPFFCGDIPDGINKVLFAWERGSKLFVTDAEQVNPNTHAVFWKQYLRQTATIYKEHNELQAKDFSFKVQELRVKSKGDERKTIGKVHVDLAQFCTEHADGQQQEVFLQLKPVGRLKCSVKATWLRNAKVDMDAMTEVTHNSEYTDPAVEEELQEEQDLSGFDPETGGALPACSNYEDYFDEATGEWVQRRKKKKKKKRHRDRLPAEIPEGFDAPQDANDTYYHEPAAAHSHEQHAEPSSNRPSQGGEAPKRPPRPKTQQPQDPANMETGRQVHKTSIKDLLCCCLPKTGLQQDAQERDGLLKQQRVVEMRANKQ